MAGKPLDQLLTQTDPEGCHLINLPARVWVFGGHCQSQGPFLSLRDAFWRTALAHHPAPVWFKDLDRPEDNAGWLEHSGYSDLLEFERDACYLAKATILFAESPGAYAELGAVCIDTALLPRLAVMVQHKHTQGASLNSFLYLGPLRRVQTDGCLCVIGDEPFQLSNHDFTEIVETVNNWLPGSHKKEKLQPDNRTHRLLLLADLVDLLLIATEAELDDALKHFGIFMPIPEIRRSLKLLKFLSLVSMHQSGVTPYWVRHDANQGPWVDYTAAIGESRFERARFKVKANELIESNPRIRPIYERGRR